MSAPGPPREGSAVDTGVAPRPRVVRLPAKPSTPGPSTPGPPPPTTRTVTWPTWPPEPFPGPSEVTPMRPAPVRVLTTKVTTPPANTRGVVEASAPPVSAAPPATAVGPVADPQARPARRGGESPRGFRWTVIATIALSVVVGGLVARMITGDDPEHVATAVATTTPVSSSTEMTAPPTTSAVTTTTAAPTNSFGLVVGTPASNDSAHPEERFAAHLGIDDTQASPMTPAALYASWWKLFIGAHPAATASASGFAVADAAGQLVELTGFVLGTDGQVSDLVECAHGTASTPTCNRLTNVISLDTEQPVVGESANVTFRRLGEMRLLRDRTVRFVSMAAAQPVTAAMSVAGDVRFDDHVLAISVPSAAVPATVDVTLTYADGASETVTVTV